MLVQIKNIDVIWILLLCVNILAKLTSTTNIVVGYGWCMRRVPLYNHLQIYMGLTKFPNHILYIYGLETLFYILSKRNYKHTHIWYWWSNYNVYICIQQHPYIAHLKIFNQLKKCTWRLYSFRLDLFWYHQLKLKVCNMDWTSQTFKN